LGWEHLFFKHTLIGFEVNLGCANSKQKNRVNAALAARWCPGGQTGMKFVAHRAPNGARPEPQDGCGSIALQGGLNSLESPVHNVNHYLNLIKFSKNPLTQWQRRPMKRLSGSPATRDQICPRR
jgi:hypothetical protein